MYKHLPIVVRIKSELNQISFTEIMFRFATYLLCAFIPLQEVLYLPKMFAIWLRRLDFLPIHVLKLPSLTKALMIQLRPQIVVGEPCVAPSIVVSLVDDVLALFRVDVGQDTGTGAGRT